MSIEIRMDQRRGCGWRKSGLYLVSDGLGKECFKLPMPLHRCPTCDSGIKATRGWTWVDADVLLSTGPCRTNSYCNDCALSSKLGRCGLLWIGEQYYKSPQDFTREALQLGVSRRISTIPHGFIIGKTWVLLAHRKAIRQPDGSLISGIFQIFRPKAVEYVTKGDESDDEIQSLIQRGVTPVQVVKQDGGLFSEINLEAKGVM